MPIIYETEPSISLMKMFRRKIFLQHFRFVLSKKNVCLPTHEASVVDTKHALQYEERVFCGYCNFSKVYLLFYVFKDNYRLGATLPLVFASGITNNAPRGHIASMLSMYITNGQS